MNFVGSRTQYAILKLLTLENFDKEIGGYDDKAIDLVLSTLTFGEAERQSLMHVKEQMREGVSIVRALADCPIFDAPVRLLLSSTKIGTYGGDALDSALSYLEHFESD